jgi:ferrous iron transport protein B
MDAAPHVSEAQAPFDLAGGVGDALATIPENLIGLADLVLDPLGLSIGDVSSLETAAEAQAVELATFGSMVKLFDGRIGAFAYLLMVLLYIPCVAATAAIYRETNLRWTLFACAWTAGLAYGTATSFYQIATIGRHPASSLTWIAVLGALFAAVVFFMRQMGRKAQGVGPAALLKGARA